MSQMNLNKLAILAKRKHNKKYLDFLKAEIPRLLIFGKRLTVQITKNYKAK